MDLQSRLWIPTCMCLLSGMLSTGDAVAGGFDPSTYPLDVPIPSRKGLTGVLDNGVRYAIERHAEHENADRAHVRVTIEVGSYYESPAEAGLAHGLEHVTFRGSRRYSERKLRAFMEKLGSVGRFSHQNGSTSQTATVYILNVPEDSGKNVPRAIDILADRIAAPRLRQADVASEIDIILEEERARRRRPAQKQYDSIVYGVDHPWSTRSPIGTRASVSAFTAEAMRSFHERWYRPERTQVVVVGDIDPDRVLGHIGKSFGSFAPSASPDTVLKDVPLPTGYAAAVIEDENVPLMGVSVNFSGPSEPVYTIAALTRSVARGVGARILADRIRDFGNQTASVVGARYTRRAGPHIRFDGFAVTAAAGRELEAFRNLMAIVRAAIADGFTEGEIQTAKSLIDRALDQLQLRRGRVRSASIAADWSESGLLGFEPLGVDATVAGTRHVLGITSADTVRQALRERLQTGRRTLVVRVENGKRNTVDLPAFEAQFKRLLDCVDSKIRCGESR